MAEKVVGAGISNRTKQLVIILPIFRFRITNKRDEMTIHGTITSLEDFNKLVQEIRERRALTQGYGLPYRQEFFRGQLSSEWNVKSSLSRHLKSAEQVITMEKKVIESFKEELEKQNYLHKIFLHEKPREYQNEWAWLCQAQHYGIPTRLMDWTVKPEVALFFSVDDPQFDEIDGQLLALYVPLWLVKVEGGGFDQFYDINPKDIDDTWFLNPGFYFHNRQNDATAEVRRARQFGKFTMQTFEKSLIGIDEQPEFHVPWDENLEVFTLEKYIIPAFAKPQLRLDLASKGWYGEYLYGGDDQVINEIRDQCRKMVIEVGKK